MNKRNRLVHYGLTAMLTLMLWAPAALSPATAEAQGFQDTSSHWGSAAIDWAVGQKIVDGYEDGTFKPDNKVSEPEFLAMLLRAYPSIPINAAKAEEVWYAPYYAAADSHHWTLLHNPDRAKYNRGYVARLIASTQNGPLTQSGSIQFLLDNGLSQGKTAATVDGYQAGDSLTRAEAVQFIMNLKNRLPDLQPAPTSAESDAAPAPAAAEATPVPAAETAPAPASTPPAEASNASISARGVALGDSLNQVLQKLGQPARMDASEYGFTWYIYNQDYKNYVQIGISGDQVVALYSPSDNWHTDRGIQDGVAKSTVENLHGSPVPYIQKGNTQFMQNYGKNEFGTYEVNGVYVTFFYDIYRDNVVTGMQAIAAPTESTMAAFYPQASGGLVQAYERQSFDLANATRAKLGYPAYTWSDTANGTARKHSQDMADRNYFDHTDLNGLSPFDRMQQDGIQFSSAAENIAAGQTSAIFAHHGWMNSEGHRKNLLSDIQQLGVGVAFGGQMHIYYTQNFFTP